MRTQEQYVDEIVADLVEVLVKRRAEITLVSDDPNFSEFQVSGTGPFSGKEYRVIVNENDAGITVEEVIRE